MGGEATRPEEMSTSCGMPLCRTLQVAFRLLAHPHIHSLTYSLTHTPTRQARGMCGPVQYGRDSLSWTHWASPAGGRGLCHVQYLHAVVLQAALAGGPAEARWPGGEDCRRGDCRLCAAAGAIFGVWAWACSRRGRWCTCMYLSIVLGMYVYGQSAKSQVHAM